MEKSKKVPAGKRAAGELTEIGLRVPLSASGGVEIMEAVLAQLGVPLTSVARRSSRRHTSVVFYETSAARAEALSRDLARLRVPGLKIRRRSLPREAWRETWKEAIRPFVLTPSFDVVPVWQRARYRPGKRVPLYIDTTLSFGTGLHETTRFMARLLERCRGRFYSFLDVGTGTGILALVAYHCGAREIDILDISRDCITTAKKNLRLNRVPLRSAFTADVAGKAVSGPYDCVAANLTTTDLLKTRARLLRLTAKGGFLALSGIGLEHLAELRRAYAGSPLRCLRVLRGKEWAAALYRKTG